MSLFFYSFVLCVLFVFFIFAGTISPPAVNLSDQLYIAWSPPSISTSIRAQNRTVIHAQSGNLVYPLWFWFICAFFGVAIYFYKKKRILRL